MAYTRSNVFKLVKYIYIAMQTFGLIVSVIVFIAGVYIWADKSYSYETYTFDQYDTNDEDGHRNSADIDKADTLDANDREFRKNLVGAVLTFGGLLAVAFYLTGIYGAIKENVTITRVIFILSAIGTISQLVRVRFNFSSFIIELLFLALIFEFLRLLKKERIARQQNITAAYTGDVEGCPKVVDTQLPPYTPYVYAEDRPPSYDDNDKAKILS